MRNEKIRSLLSKIGPYPLNPYLIFLFFFSFYLARLTPTITQQPPGIERVKATFFVLVFSLFPGLIFALYALLMQRFRPWESLGLIRYIIQILFGQILFGLCGPAIHKFLLNRYSIDFHIFSAINIQFFLGSAVLTLTGVALIHRAERKILERLDTANILVRKLKIDREELINLDEDIRRQTSLFLHDRVQSDLIVVGIKLKSISGKSSDEVNEVIELAIAQLENSRGKDLRSLIQTLSPNFETAGLKGSLDVLIRQYESSISISVQIDSETEKLDSQYLLGIYRIIEQALLNSLVHGPATKVLVTVSTSAAGATEISVADDGPGADLATVQSGIGSAIIDSWVGILEGKKTVDTVPGHGYRLVINFPAN